MPAWNGKRGEGIIGVRGAKSPGVLAAVRSGNLEASFLVIYYEALFLPVLTSKKRCSALNIAIASSLHWPAFRSPLTGLLLDLN